MSRSQDSRENKNKSQDFREIMNKSQESREFMNKSQDSRENMNISQTGSAENTQRSLPRSETKFYEKEAPEAMKTIKSFVNNLKPVIVEQHLPPVASEAIIIKRTLETPFASSFSRIKTKRK